MLCLVVLIRTAWMTDDALISVRSALNFVHGYGPTFNLAERVQSYTHPLWFLLLSGLLTLIHNPFLILWGLSFVCTIGVCVLLEARLARGLWQGAVGILVLLTSKAFVDFSASGLENPLAHILLVVFVLVAIRTFDAPRFPTLVALAATGSALYLTRADLMVLVAPVGVVIAWRERLNPRRLAAAFALGALPAIAWTGVSLWYYGFPFPNTAYAKLGTGWSVWQRTGQGFTYLADSLQRDFITLPALGLGILLGLRSRGVDRAMALGVACYLAYVVWIGGDFMSGRFLTVPLLAAVIVIVRAPLNRTGLAAAAVGVACLALPTLGSTLLSGPEFHNKSLSDAGIADERGFYFQGSGLVAGGWADLRHGSEQNPRQWTETGRGVLIVCGRLGSAGMAAGPGVHLIDPCGLADPLLARLPPREDLEQRVGHLARSLPTGYLDSVRDGGNHVADEDLRAFYELLRHITRGPLLDRSRLMEIARLNLGWSDEAERLEARFWGAPLSVDVLAVSRVVEQGAAWNAPGHIVFDREVDFMLPSPQTVEALDLSVDWNDSYRIEAIVGWHEVPIAVISADGPPPSGTGVVRRRFELPDAIEDVTAVRVTALGGDGAYSVGHLVVFGSTPNGHH